MRRYFILLILITLIGVGMYYLVKEDYFSKWDEKKHQLDISNLPQIKSEQQKKEMLPLLKGDLFEFVGVKDKELIESFGEPVRKSLSLYGYTWWVYTDGVLNYIQFGIKEGEVVTIFATGQDISSAPLEIGESYETVKETFPLENKITYQDGLAFYNFILGEEDIKTDPLIKLADDLFVQCYFDTFTNELSSIRVLTGDVLLEQRLYEMEYRGPLPEEENIENKDREKIQQGMEQAIFDLTNVYRNRFGKDPLISDEQVKDVALLHSKDMSENNYFSHYRMDGSGLKERLAEKDIYYLSAGENIAAQHTDGAAAMEGWMNSEGHREALLHEDYTHLGVGVYRLYYTQNFLLKP